MNIQNNIENNILKDYLKLCCFFNEDNIFHIRVDIYKNELIHKYINENIKTIKDIFYNVNWSHMIKSKRLPNQILKCMLKKLHIPFDRKVIANNSHKKISTTAVFIIKL